MRVRPLQWSMWIAHFGVVIFLIGALGESVFTNETVARMQIGEQIQIGADKAYRSRERGARGALTVPMLAR